MKLTAQQLLMPMLIGLSLTGVSVVLLYLFTKKDEDEATKRRKTFIETSRQSEIHLKVAREFVPAVIGRGGSVIKGIQRDTETQIKFKEENDLEAPERICIIRGKPECIRFAETMILTIIKNQPIIETYELPVPQRAVGKIMGTRGENIKHIQNVSSAKIIMDAYVPTNDPNLERRLIIKGTAEQIATAVSLLEEKMQEDNLNREKLESNTRQPRNRASRQTNGVQNENAVADSTFEESKTDLHLGNEKKSEADTTDNSTVIHSEPVPESLPTQDSSMEIYVSAMDNPSKFWVQVYGKGTLELDDLIYNMTKYYENKENAELHVLKNITIGQMVAAKFSFDGRWYRSEVISGPEDGKYEVFFVDFGDCERVCKEDILELRTDFLSLRLQAIECSLANVKPRDGEWSDKACDRFADLSSLAQWKRLFAKVEGYKERVVGCRRSRREGSPIPSITIYDIIDNKEIDIGRELINEDLADPEDEVLSPASSTLSVSKRNPDFSKSPTPTAFTRSPDPPVRSERTNKVIEEIDVTTPNKRSSLVEEVDLVTPKENAYL